MKCSCCGGDADTVLETESSGVSFLCELCSDAVFVMLMQPSIEKFYQGEREYGREGYEATA